MLVLAAFLPSVLRSGGRNLGGTTVKLAGGTPRTKGTHLEREHQGTCLYSRAHSYIKFTEGSSPPAREALEGVLISAGLVGAHQVVLARASESRQTGRR